MRRLALAVLIACSPHASSEPPATPPPSTSTVDESVASGSPGCGKSASKGVQKRTATAMSKPRSYTLVVPDDYHPKQPYPVVFALHGNGGSGKAVRTALDLEKPAAGKAIFVYPDAVGGGWDLDDETGKNRDVAFFDVMLLELHGSLCVDERRIFVAGFSNGAYMANQLGCKRGERIRAVATHSGGGPYENGGSYDDQGHLLCPGKAVASLVIHGTSDTTVLPSEGQKSIDHWSFANRCSGGSTSLGPAACVTLNGCVQPVTTCKVPGLGHAVWGEAKRLIWSFFDGLR